MVVMPIVEKIEDRESLAIDDDCRAVDDARLHRRGGHRGSDLRETRSKIIAIAGEPSHAIALAPGQDPKAVVLDFVNPATAARRRVCPPRKAGLELDGVQSTRPSKGESQCRRQGNSKSHNCNCDRIVRWDSKHLGHL